ncbi:hypothetical protein LTR08_001776 [Meristemomyces frigidus]|nr:hypothetical protein LTR08_001776 [Meristemomyces frigidus]
MNASSLAVGQQIELNDGRVATVRFAGTTSFQLGDWIGVELDEATGKNDGSVKGERYFECEPGYGMFLRPTGVRRVVEDVKPKARPSAATNGGIGRSRPSSVHSAVDGLRRRDATDGPGKRGSAIGSPTPGARLGSGLRSPTKSPTKQLGTNGSSSSSGPYYGLAKAIYSSGYELDSTTAKLPTLACTSAHTLEAYICKGDAARLSSTTEDTADDDGSGRPSLLSPRESGSPAPGQPEKDQEHQPEEEVPKPSFAPPPIPPDSPRLPRSRRPSSPTAASIHSQRTLRSTVGANRQIEELEAKVRLLERKRQDDREVKKNLDQAQKERDQYKGIIEKLQNKYRPQQQEILDMKQALRESESRFADIEAIQVEHDEVMELATIDRETAEETAEGLQAELEALRAKNEEMELELEVLRDENGELSKEMSPEERTSTGWLQMEKSNERLREALLRLRDITQDKEAELREQVASMEDQVKEVDAVKSQYAETKEALLRSEADTGDLRQELEVALESDDMIEELTDRNGRLEDQLAQLRTTIEELEDLRELNDELEVNHTEQEKQLQEEIDFKDSLIFDRERTSKQQQEALDEADYTVTRYRALVSQMQSDLADMQASKQLSQTEAADLNSKSRAMLDLNMKLQTSAAKTQVKTIDLELRKLEAQEASEHLAIVQLFLPDAFHAERDSVLALLRFKRIGFKANLVHGFVKERVGSFGARGLEEDVFAACDVMDKLVWIAAMAERFVGSICSCGIEEFARYESALYELEPVERALNSYIDGLRREELREKDMAQELQRSIAVMTHLATLHVQDDLASHADNLLMRTLCLQSQLETAATALGLTRSLVESNVSASAPEDESEDEVGSASDLSIILNRAEALMSHARNAKVMAGKTYRSLSDLQQRSLTLEGLHADAFGGAETVAAQVAAYTQQAGEALQMLFGEEGRNESFTPDEIASTLARAASSVFSLPSPEAGPFAALATRLRELTDILSDLAQLPADLDNAVEFERAPAPWVARSRELKQTKITSIDTEAELARALESLRERDIVLKAKETELEEQSVRIEMLEARMKEAGKRSARIAELERTLHEAKDNEKRSRADVNKARQDADKEVERIREEMGCLAEERRKGGDGKALDDGAMGAGARLDMKHQAHKIVSLEGAVRYLQDENSRLHLPAADSSLSVRATLDWLHEPLIKPASDKRKRHDALQREGKSVLQQMLLLATRPQNVDLTKMPENKLAWRPAKETARWNVESRREEWVSLKGWRRDVTRMGAGFAAASILPAV